MDDNKIVAAILALGVVGGGSGADDEATLQVRKYALLDAYQELLTELRARPDAPRS